jgi:uncharacterized protein
MIFLSFMGGWTSKAAYYTLSPANGSLNRGEVGIRRMLLRLFIRLNNTITKWRRVRVPCRNLLLIFPHCLHADSCPRNIRHSLDECRRCGRCRIANLLKVRDEYGLICCVAGGGREALRHTRRDDVMAIVAVACEKELLQGVLAAFPKPVLAVPNCTPQGPCRNTDVDMAKVIAAIDSMVVREGQGHSCVSPET